MGQDIPARDESWRKTHFSPHLPSPPWEWTILDYGYYYLTKPVPGGLGGINEQGLFCNSAGQPYDPQPGVVWTVEEYVKQRQIYDSVDRLYLPGLIKGSPACDSYLAEMHVQAALGDAKTFSDLLAGQAVDSSRNDDVRKAFSYIMVWCDELAGDRKQALLKLRARVCRHHELDISEASQLGLPDFARLLRDTDPPLSDTTKS